MPQRKRRKPDTGSSFEFKADDRDGVIARHQWLPLILDARKQIQALAARPQFQRVWTDALRQMDADPGLDPVHHLHETLTGSLDLAPELVTLLVLSQGTPTLAAINQTIGRLPTKAR